jgi:DNA-binding MarR family transcriptional regulator
LHIIIERVSRQASSTYRFGDLLALVREHWVRQMADRLAAAGHADYRRSDAALVRLLSRGSRSVGEIGAALGVSRQAARKLVAGLERRGYASSAKDRDDARQLNVELTARGEAFAAAIIDAIEALNRRLARRVDPAQLLAADAALRAALPDRGARERAARLVAPPEQASS